MCVCVWHPFSWFITYDTLGRLSIISTCIQIGHSQIEFLALKKAILIQDVKYTFHFNTEKKI